MMLRFGSQTKGSVIDPSERLPVESDRVEMENLRSAESYGFGGDVESCTLSLCKLNVGHRLGHK
jgi:hypothetical protein